MLWVLSCFLAMWPTLFRRLLAHPAFRSVAMPPALPLSATVSPFNWRSPSSFRRHKSSDFCPHRHRHALLLSRRPLISISDRVLSVAVFVDEPNALGCPRSVNCMAAGRRDGRSPRSQEAKSAVIRRQLPPCVAEARPVP